MASLDIAESRATLSQLRNGPGSSWRLLRSIYSRPQPVAVRQPIAGQSPVASWDVQRRGSHPIRRRFPGRPAAGCPACGRSRAGSCTWSAGRPPAPLEPCSRCAGGRSPAPPRHAPPPGRPSAPGACCGSCCTREKRVSGQQPRQSTLPPKFGARNVSPTGVFSVLFCP
ncbi:unnamed protein product [Ixodes pacificus]